MTDLNDNGLGADEQSRFDSLYGTQPQTPAVPNGPGIFTGAPKGLAGIPAGAAGVALSTASFATDANDVLGNTYADAIGYRGTMQDAPWNQQHRAIDDYRKETADFYRPDAATTGFVGNTLYGVSDVLSRVLVGNAILPGSGLTAGALTSGYERSADLQDQGVDANTAFGSGALTAGSLLAGGFAGTVGKTVAARVASGATTNLAFGTGTRALDSAILSSNGYTAQAQQQKWNDAASIASDLVIGGAFGFLPHGTNERPAINADTIDSAITAKNADSVAQAAPGVPADARSSAAHVDALDTATGQLMDGQSVAVDPIVRDTSFLDRGDTTILRTPAEAGDIVDRRLAALDDTAKGVRSKAELRSLFSEAGDLEDLLREQYRNDEQGVVVSPENRLSPEDRSFAENRLADIRKEVETSRSAVWADAEGKRLRDKLARNTEDADLVRIARSIHPEQVEPGRAAPRPLESDVRDALVESGVRASDLDSTEDDVVAKGAGDALMERLRANPDQVFSDYAARPESEGGRVLNTDTARELSPEYLADRTRSADVHEAASETVKQLYAKKLAEPTPEGLDPTVLFTAGGTGAGKSTAIRGLSADIPSPEIVYDTNMNTYASAEKKVEQALAAGRDATILYVYRDPVEALTGGALPRAERQRAEFGSGRTVPLAEHARTHLGVRDVIDRLAEKYKDDPRVRIKAYDNSRGRDNGSFADLADIPRVEQNGLHERLKDALDQEHQAGRVSDATRAGFDAPGRAGSVSREAVSGTRRESPQERQVTERGPADTSPSDAADGGLQDARRPKPGNPDANPEAQPRTGLDPARDAEVELARQSVEEAPDLVLEDGTTAADAMRAADHEVTQAEKTGSGIQAAIACFLRFGEDAA